MAEKKPVKMSDADLKFFEEMLLEKRRELVTAQSESEKANVFQGQKSQSGDGGDSDGADSATDYNSLETNFSLAAREGKYLVYKARLMAVPTATKCVNCKEETKKKEILDNRMEMAKMFAEAQRKEMLRKASGR